MIMVMNTDSTATLAFIKKLPFKDLEQLHLTMRMGDMSVITKHVQYDYNMIRYQTSGNINRLKSIIKAI